MLPILQKLKFNITDFPVTFADEKSKVWSFSEKIKTKDAIFFEYLVRHHGQICLEYHILCTQLAHDLKAKDVKISDVSQQLEAALVMAELLEQVYRDYLIIPREVISNRREQEIYRQLLALDGYQFPDQDKYLKIKTSSSSPSKTIRDLTVSTNWPRLLILRTRRLLISIIPLVRGFDVYGRWIGAMEVTTNFVVPYLAWIFFLPRLLTNLFLLGKHLIAGSWMQKPESDLGWRLRLKAQMDRRWFEIGNDAAWFTGGLVNCFVLIGVLGPSALFLSLALQVYDVVLAAIRFHLEISSMEKLEREYKWFIFTTPVTDPSYEKANDYLIYLHERIHYEKKRLSISIINNCVLVVSLSLTLGIVAFTPIMPLVGAVLAVMMTIACYVAAKCIDQQKPKPMETIKKFAHDHQTAIDKLGFFRENTPPSPSSSTSSSSLEEPTQRDPLIP